MNAAAHQRDTQRPIGWYVHLPFCPTKCGYCDFYSLPTREDWIDDLVRAVCAEITLRDPHRSVRSIFVGGGTPTVLPADALRTVLDAIPRGDADAEFTVEANPSSADELKLDLLRRCGVNRVSFGAQSFHRDELAVLERLHNPDHISDAVRLARQAGFDNVNLDLIFGVPGQTVPRWLDSLRRAIELGVDHIACYSLMYEEGTALTKRKRLGLLEPCNEDVEAEMYERTIDLLAAAGYAQYEISNFARPGRQCRHNLIYWHNEEYVGVGPSAVSYVDGVRRKNLADVKRYMEGMNGDVADTDRLIVESERLTGEPHARETAIQLLRLTSGIDIAAFEGRTGLDPMALFADAVETFGRSGHVCVERGHIRLTRRGLMVANRVMAEFLTEPAASSRV